MFARVHGATLSAPVHFNAQALLALSDDDLSYIRRDVKHRSRRGPLYEPLVGRRDSHQYPLALALGHVSKLLTILSVKRHISAVTTKDYPVLTPREIERLYALCEALANMVPRPWPPARSALVRRLWRFHVQGRQLVEHTTALIRRVDRRAQ